MKLVDREEKTHDQEQHEQRRLACTAESSRSVALPLTRLGLLKLYPPTRPPRAFITVFLFLSAMGSNFWLGRGRLRALQRGGRRGDRRWRIHDGRTLLRRQRYEK